MSRAGGPTAHPGAPALGLGLSQLFFLIWSLSSSVAKSDLREDVTHLLSACCGRGGPSREAGLREAGRGDAARSPGPLLWGWCHPPPPPPSARRGGARSPCPLTHLDRAPQPSTLQTDTPASDEARACLPSSGERNCSADKRASALARGVQARGVRSHSRPVG